MDIDFNEIFDRAEKAERRGRKPIEVEEFDEPLPEPEDPDEDLDEGRIIRSLPEDGEDDDIEQYIIAKTFIFSGVEGEDILREQVKTLTGKSNMIPFQEYEEDRIIKSRKDVAQKPTATVSTAQFTVKTLFNRDFNNIVRYGREAVQSKDLNLEKGYSSAFPNELKRNVPTLRITEGEMRFTTKKNTTVMGDIAEKTTGKKDLDVYEYFLNGEQITNKELANIRENMFSNLTEDQYNQYDKLVKRYTKTNMFRMRGGEPPKKKPLTAYQLFTRDVDAYLDERDVSEAFPYLKILELPILLDSAVGPNDEPIEQPFYGLSVPIPDVVLQELNIDSVVGTKTLKGEPYTGIVLSRPQALALGVRIWKQLTPDEKQPFIDMADQQRAEYLGIDLDELDNYKVSKIKYIGEQAITEKKYSMYENPRQIIVQNSTHAGYDIGRRVSFPLPAQRVEGIVTKIDTRKRQLIVMDTFTNVINTYDFDTIKNISVGELPLNYTIDDENRLVKTTTGFVTINNEQVPVESLYIPGTRYNENTLDKLLYLRRQRYGNPAEDTQIKSRYSELFGYDADTREVTRLANARFNGPEFRGTVMKTEAIQRQENLSPIVRQESKSPQTNDPLKTIMTNIDRTVANKAKAERNIKETQEYYNRLKNIKNPVYNRIAAKAPSPKKSPQVFEKTLDIDIMREQMAMRYVQHIQEKVDRETMKRQEITDQEPEEYVPTDIEQSDLSFTLSGRKWNNVSPGNLISFDLTFEDAVMKSGKIVGFTDRSLTVAIEEETRDETYLMPYENVVLLEEDEPEFEKADVPISGREFLTSDPTPQLRNMVLSLYVRALNLPNSVTVDETTLSVYVDPKDMGYKGEKLKSYQQLYDEKSSRNYSKLEEERLKNFSDFMEKHRGKLLKDIHSDFEELINAEKFSETIDVYRTMFNQYSTIYYQTYTDELKEVYDYPVIFGSEERLDVKQEFKKLIRTLGKVRRSQLVERTKSEFDQYYLLGASYNAVLSFEEYREKELRTWHRGYHRDRCLRDTLAQAQADVRHYSTLNNQSEAFRGMVEARQQIREDPDLQEMRKPYIEIMVRMRNELLAEECYNSLIITDKDRIIFDDLYGEDLIRRYNEYYEKQRLNRLKLINNEKIHVDVDENDVRLMDELAILKDRKGDKDMYLHFVANTNPRFTENETDPSQAGGMLKTEAKYAEAEEKLPKMFAVDSPNKPGRVTKQKKKINNEEFAPPYLDLRQDQERQLRTLEKYWYNNTSNSFDYMIRAAIPLVFLTDLKSIALYFNSRVRDGFYRIDELQYARYTHMIPELMANYIKGGDLTTPMELIGNIVSRKVTTLMHEYLQRWLYPTQTLVYNVNPMSKNLDVLREYTTSLIDTICGKPLREVYEVKVEKKQVKRRNTDGTKSTVDLSVEKLTRVMKPDENGNMVPSMEEIPIQDLTICYDKKRDIFTCSSIRDVLRRIQRNEKNPQTGRAYPKEFVARMKERYGHVLLRPEVRYNPE